jgi:hypothetical protein
MRGKAFGFLVLLCVTWTTARIIFNISDKQADGRRQDTASLIPKKRPLAKKFPKFADYRRLGNGYVRAFQGAPAPYRVIDFHANIGLQSVASDRNAGGSQQSVDERLLHLEHVPALGPERPSAPPPLYLPTPPKHAPFNVYAYSFWRHGAVQAGQLGNGQYGGSQSAALIEIPVLRYRDAQDTSQLAVIGRLSTSHSKIRESEWAAGVQWQPIRSIPARMSIERRFRRDAPDTIAAYLAGGHAGSKLPLAFTLDGYGQAGFVSGKDAGAFVDVQLATHRPLVSQAGTQLSAGGGIWAGGQGDIIRLDVGPSVRALLSAGPARLRIDASWRFRIAGDAQPGNGPAVTLSTSF